MVRCVVAVLGGFEVRVDGSPVASDAWRSRRAADLVKLLALEPAHALHREQVMDLLWPGLGPDAAGANLRKAVHYARRAMGADQAIRATDHELSLWGGDVAVDAQAFAAAADAAVASGDVAACARAADLYRGDPVPSDRYEAWAEAPRAQMRDRYRALLKGAHRWEQAVELDPTDEEAHRELLRGYLEAGRRREAIRQFERLRDALREYIGVGPDPETIAPYERVLDLEGAVPPTAAQRATVLVATGLVHLNRGEFAEAERLARGGKETAIGAGLADELGDASTLLALVSSWTGRWFEIFRQEFFASFELEADLQLAAWDGNLCFAEFYISGSEGPDDMVGNARQLLELAVHAGSKPGEAIARVVLGEGLLGIGDAVAARGELERALALGQSIGSECIPCIALEHLARVELSAGNPELAQALLEQGQPVAIESRLRSHLLVRLLGVGVEVPAHAAAPLAAVTAAERALAATSRVCDPCSINFRLQAASASARAGDLARARSHLGKAERIAGMWQGGPWAAGLWEARAALRLAEGEPAQAVAFLREAADGFARARRPADEQRCRTAAAALV